MLPPPASPSAWDASGTGRTSGSTVTLSSSPAQIPRTPCPACVRWATRRTRLLAVSAAGRWYGWGRWRVLLLRPARCGSTGSSGGAPSSGRRLGRSPRGCCRGCLSEGRIKKCYWSTLFQKSLKDQSVDIVVQRQYSHLIFARIVGFLQLFILNVINFCPKFSQKCPHMTIFEYIADD